MTSHGGHNLLRKWGRSLKTNPAHAAIAAAYLALLVHAAVFAVCLIKCLYRLDYTLMATGSFYRTFVFTTPPLLWLMGTSFDYFNYRRMKRNTYLLAALQEVLLVISLGFQLLSELLLPRVMSIRADAIFTPGMVLLLARILTEIPLIFLTYLLIKTLLRPLRDPRSYEALISFRLSHLWSSVKKSRRENIEYTLAIVKNIETGKPVVVRESDRYLHTLVDGTSGTGKTSSTILPAIRDDLCTRARAEKLQKSLISELLEKGSIECMNEAAPFSVNNYSPSPESANDGIKQLLDDIRLKHAVCGITVLAPDSSLTDDVCRLAEAQNAPYHRIDATRTADGLKKSNLAGMNPFFLPIHTDEESRQKLIIKKAVIFADVMQAITDLKGSADSYFTNLNRQLIANLAILVMHTVPMLSKRQATPADLQLLINNFDLLPPYVSALETLDQGKRHYNFIVQYIRDDLLGKGRVKMEDQSRGTRNIINEFLLMPDSREIFCSQNSLDFDRVLMNGEITVCNYDLASGDTNAVAFGLFFLLSFNNSVLSRPGTEKTRTAHFFYIDELPVLIHSSVEKNFSLFRKYKVAMFSAIQTLDQFEKNQLTKYLKGVVLGCAHIIAFGRSSLSDMQIFSAMAGVREQIDEQNTVSETALSGDSPVLSYSSRETSVQKNTLEEIDIRMQDFQQVTFFTVMSGRPLPPIKGRVEFLTAQDWEGQQPFAHPNVPSSRRAGKGVSHGDSVPPYMVNERVTSCYSMQQDVTRPPYETLGTNTPPHTGNTLPKDSESIEDLF